MRSIQKKGHQLPMKKIERSAMGAAGFDHWTKHGCCHYEVYREHFFRKNARKIF
jgi:hypothetical protein